MNQLVFYVNGQVISFFSLLIMVAVIFFSIYERKQAGYALPNWMHYIFIFLALDAVSGMLLAGFQLTETAYFYTIRRLFSLLSICLPSKGIGQM